MTERGLPLANGAQACPFVAFEDDRDERASSPDHRHRCYAELRPAPRALAHQAAYCLSSAFPVCPTFQDWAAREAARARSGAESPAEDDSDDSDDSPRRNPPREWSAPPPWMNEHEDGDEDADDRGSAGLWGAAAVGGAGAAGAAAAGVGGAAVGAGMGGPTGPLGGQSGVDPDDVQDQAAGQSPRDPPDFLAARSREGAGLSGSAADRLADGDPPHRREGDIDRDLDHEDRGEVPGRVGAFEELAPEDPRVPVQDLPASQRRAPVDSRGGDRRTMDRGGSERRPRVGETRRPPPVDPDAPAWEQPRRYEAYPTLKTRMGLPSLSRVAIMAVALVVAAVALFFLPTLLGLGKVAQIGSGPTASPSTRPVASAAVTPVPAATPLVYVVQANDTLEKIRRKFKVTIEALLAANPQIKDPNKIKIGDPITIPTSAPAASAKASSSASAAP